ncbi:MAG: hypothetical protein WCG83_02660 [Candidatus Peregrinibacteria bacterium]
MFLRITQSAFLIAGIALITGGLGQLVLSRSLASLTDQGSTVIQEVNTIPMFKEGYHAVATSEPNLAGLVVLGAIFMIIGLGIHAFYIRKHTGERKVPVHDRQGRDSRKPNHWVLWMNVRM